MREAARLPDQMLGVKRWELDPTRTSVLEGVKKFEKGMPGGRRPPVVFFSLFGRWFVRYSFDTARVVYAGIALATLTLIAFFEVCRPPRPAAQVSGTVEKVEKARKGKKGSESTSGYAATPTWKIYVCSLVVVGSSVVSGLFVANTIAFIMRSVVDRQLSWFQEERRCLWLYAPATILGTFESLTLSWTQKCVLTYPIGMLSPLPVISSYVHPASRSRLERATIHATLFWSLLVASGIQFLGVGSAVVFALLSLGVTIGLAIGETTELFLGHLNAAVSPVVCDLYLDSVGLFLILATDLSARKCRPSGDWHRYSACDDRRIRPFGTACLVCYYIIC